MTSGTSHTSGLIYTLISFSLTAFLDLPWMAYNKDNPKDSN